MIPVFPEGIWIWVRNGEGLEFKAWCENEPNNADKNEHCLHLYGDPDPYIHEFKWNDTIYLHKPLEAIMPKIEGIVNDLFLSIMRSICENAKFHLNIRNQRP